jgi:hypothetical protein
MSRRKRTRSKRRKSKKRKRKKKKIHLLKCRRNISYQLNTTSLSIAI